MWAIDTNIDLGCGRTMEADIALGSSMGPEVTLASDGSAITQIIIVEGDSMVLSYQYSFRRQPSSQ